MVKPVQPADAGSAVKSRIGDICLKARHAAITEREALEAVIEQESALTLDDYNYLIHNGVFDSVKKWGKTQAAKMLKADMDLHEEFGEDTDPVEAALNK
jgi:hypothetical protein